MDDEAGMRARGNNGNISWSSLCGILQYNGNQTLPTSLSPLLSGAVLASHNIGYHLLWRSRQIPLSPSNLTLTVNNDVKLSEDERIVSSDSPLLLFVGPQD